jgi:hypothetical protein
MSDERFFCLNCQNVGLLNQQLRCGKCNSDSVVSVDAIVKTQQQTNAQTRRQPLQAKTLYVVKCGPFACTLYASDEAEAIREAPYRPWCCEDECYGDLRPLVEPVKAQQTLEQTPR